MVSGKSIAVVGTKSIRLLRESRQSSSVASASQRHSHRFHIKGTEVALHSPTVPSRNNDHVENSTGAVVSWGTAKGPELKREAYRELRIELPRVALQSPSSRWHSVAGAAERRLEATSVSAHSNTQSRVARGFGITQQISRLRRDHRARRRGGGGVALSDHAWNANIGKRKVLFYPRAKGRTKHVGSMTRLC